MQDEIKILQENISSLESVIALTAQPGWKVLKNHFDQVLQTISNQLDIEEDFSQIRRLQERKRAFKAMLETVDLSCQEYSEATLRLEDMQKIQTENDQYGL